MTSKDKYDVSRPYEDFVLPIFDTYGTTLRTQHPFANQWTHVRVHQHAAAVFAEEKKVCFLLPLIVQSHKLLPDTPVFWKNDDDTIPLYRTTMWLNQQTVEYLASTGEWYPSELRSELQPRIEACRGHQQPRKQPPDPPKPIDGKKLHILLRREPLRLRRRPYRPVQLLRKARSRHGKKHRKTNSTCRCPRNLHS